VIVFFAENVFVKLPTLQITYTTFFMSYKILPLKYHKNNQNEKVLFLNYFENRILL